VEAEDVAGAVVGPLRTHVFVFGFLRKDTALGGMIRMDPKKVSSTTLADDRGPTAVCRTWQKASTEIPKHGPACAAGCILEWRKGTLHDSAAQTAIYERLLMPQNKAA